MRHTFVPVLFARLLPATAPCDEDLIAHWPLAENSKDVSGNGLHAASHGVDFSAIGPSGTPKTAAAFDGQDALLEIPTHGAFGAIQTSNNGEAQQQYFIRSGFVLPSLRRVRDDDFSPTFFRFG